MEDTVYKLIQKYQSGGLVKKLVGVKECIGPTDISYLKLRKSIISPKKVILEYNTPCLEYDILGILPFVEICKFMFPEKGLTGSKVLVERIC